MAKLILAVDQSTSGTKALLFETGGRLLHRCSVPHRQIYPQAGWVEHDAEEIYRNTLTALRQLLEQAKSDTDQLLCLSLTNQRETFVVFEAATGRPLHNAIVWQCRRGEPICRELTEAGHDELIRHRTGLKIDSYFSGSKIAWLIRNRPDLAAMLADGRALVGTIDAYLIYRLTGGQVFATEATNACRTLLYDIHRLQWDDQLCGMFGVPMRALPTVRSSSDAFGRTDLEGLLSRPLEIRGAMGDSQAALFAQRCFRAGQAKVTFGTGSSVLVNAGSRAPADAGGIVATLAWVLDGQPTYALEGIINCTGAIIAWLKDQLGLIEDSAATEALAAQVSDNGGVYLVPAFVGMGAPYWKQDTRAAIVGLSQQAGRCHVVRAALEAIGYQVRDVLDAVAAQAGVKLSQVRADGGMTANRLLMQFVADMTGLTVSASDVAELSALGAVLAGALGAGVYKSLDQLELLDLGSVDYRPRMDEPTRQRNYEGWQRAVAMVLAAPATNQ